MLAAVTSFTVMAALVKWADRIPAGQAVFFRSVLTLPLLLGWFGARGQIREVLGTQNWKGHFRRGLVGTLAMALGFTGLRFLPLPEVTALQFATPILVVIFAAAMLGERIRLIRISAVVVGLVGVVIILLPRLSASGENSELIGAGIVLAAAACAAFAQIFIKRMTGSETPSAIVFYFALTATALSLLTVPFGWVWPTGSEWLILIGVGLIGCLGQLLLTNSYRFADASVLAPFTYVSILWAVIIGWFAFGEGPTLSMLGGSALIIVSGVAIFLRERKLGLRRAAEAKVRAKGMQ
jgi:drug/metabolite transporter (DMT)-like permease